MQRTELSSFTLDDRYARDSGVVFLTGIQALVRMAMLQRQRDELAGVRSGGFLSGYRGSPLGGLDKALWEQRQRLEALNIHFQPGVNEELAATAVWGSQQVGLFPGARVDGVFGLWYGKAPGLDRAGDAIRHANAAGTSAAGGVLLVVGDDHGCKSSTLPSHSELTLKDLGVPVLNPADVQDVLEFGLFGWALSRYAGVWSGLIALADTMDSAAAVTLPTLAAGYVRPPSDADVHMSLGRAALEQERLLVDVKLQLARAFARANGINRVLGATGGASTGARPVGVITTGKAYLDVRQALFELGIADDQALADNGVRLLKLGMSWPLDHSEIEAFADGLATIVVVEEKRAFVEDEVKSMLYGRSSVQIVGKRHADGSPGLPDVGELDVAAVARMLCRYLPRIPNDRYLRDHERRAARLDGIGGQAKTERLPMFCAGCPHNTSTRVPEGSRATAGIGCHYMAQWMDRSTATFTQMGGEGANWVGQAPFTDEPHVFVNLGDGTYFHSGILAIRQAVAAGVNVTYKILFNDAVAMTGGQPVDGALSVADLVAQVRAEGVRHVVVVSDTPQAHGALGVPVSHRDELDAVQRRLREVGGCSVLIYQQTCATEQRRRRKRGLAPDPDVRVLINDAVCEGCGDCSAQSNCVAVEPLATAYGVKRAINQTACNKDFSCVKGFCPSFVLVEGGRLRRSAACAADVEALRAQVPEPRIVATGEPANLVIAGVGGTGVVTVSALLGTAAHIDGRAVSTLDMTGLAQKGGAVFGHVRIGARLADAGGALYGTRVAPGKADLLLACDLVTGASRDALMLISDERTLALVNSDVMPTADFVLHQDSDLHVDERLARLRRFAAETRLVHGAALVQRLMGDTATLNVFLLGFAYQHGRIPLTLAALERAITLNGVAVQANLQAFHYGRLAAHDAGALQAQLPQAGDGDPRGAIQGEAPDESLDRLIADRVALLTRYQNAALSARYEALVRRVAHAEQRIRPGADALARAVAQSYAKLLAYKDEYEVARLYSDGGWQRKLDATFEGDYRVRFLLAPPLLGTRKRRFGAWMRPAFRLLAGMRRVRGSLLDPFRWGGERRAERDDIAHFERVVGELLAGLDRQNLGLAEQIAALPQQIRGFGHVKAAHRDRVLAQERRLLQAFREPPAPVLMFDPAHRRSDRHAA
ncbi:MAG: indolepyruvate ferredoxin oxidoreductase family protein [Pseudomonadales bacterium]